MLGINDLSTNNTQPYRLTGCLQNKPNPNQKAPTKTAKLCETLRTPRLNWPFQNKPKPVYGAIP
jgi:hypothetical protein